MAEVERRNVAFDPDVGPKDVPGTGPDRYPQAYFFHDRKHYYSGYFGGIGIGKTRTLTIDFFEYAVTYPGSVQILTEPSMQMIRDIMLPAILTDFGSVEGNAFRMTRSPPFNITFTNKSETTGQPSEIWLRPTEFVGQRLYGPSVARVGCDEVTLGYQEEAVNILDGRCRQPGYPHQMKFTGTPKGRDWVHAMFIERPEPDVRAYLAQTRDNHHLPEGYYERLVRRYGGEDTPRARQELGGAWIAMTGPVHPEFDYAIHVIGVPDADPRSYFTDIIGGIDPGAINPTALVVTGKDRAGHLVAITEFYRHGCGIDETADAMSGLESVFGQLLWIIDPSASAWQEQLINTGFRVEKATHGNDIKLRVQLASGRLGLRQGGRPGAYISSACPNLASEIHGLSYQRVKLPGRGEEIMRDRFERGAPDHAYDAWCNTISYFDSPMLELPPRKERPAWQIKSLRRKSRTRG